MHHAIQNLALDLVEHIKTSYDPRAAGFYEELSRYQIASGKFIDALSSYNIVREQVAKRDSTLAQEILFVYHAFAGIKSVQEQSGMEMDILIRNGLERKSLEFDPGIWQNIESQFKVDLKIIQKLFNDKKDELRNKKTDSLLYDAAKDLCYLYTDYIVYTSMLPAALPTLARIKNIREKLILQDSVLIPVRDGAVISARIMRKKDIAYPMSVIFKFSIYPKPPDKAELTNWAENDYVGVVAYTRGKYLSQQEVEPFEHDANDAYDIIEWISRQPWCNGKIGMTGGSYDGFTQWAALKKIHPALKTIVPRAATAPGIDFKRNGLYETRMLNQLNNYTNSKSDRSLRPVNWDSVLNLWYDTGRSFRSFDTVAGIPNKIFQRWLHHPSYDQFYQKMIPYQGEFAGINIPVFSITGYFDGDQLGALYYFTEHYKYNKKANHHLIIGPYDHPGAAADQQVNPVQGYLIEPAARISLNELIMKWFNYILKDSSRPSFLKAKINFQVMGTNRWRHVASMDQMNNDTLTFYLTNPVSGKHLTLSEKPGKGHDYCKYMVDFRKRELSDNERKVMIFDTMLNTKGYLSFVSKPLQESLSVNGRIFSDLHCIINKSDFDIEMEVYELMPDGRYFLLSWYVGRASYAGTRERRNLLTPGRKEIIPVRDTDFTSRQISKGSRLVLVLGVIKNNEYQVNYGTGKDVSDETIEDGKTPLEIKWLASSWIKVPVFKDK